MVMVIPLMAVVVVIVLVYKAKLLCRGSKSRSESNEDIKSAEPSRVSASERLMSCSKQMLAVVVGVICTAVSCTVS